MLVKWVSCAVGDLAGFAAAQRGWSALSGTAGFLGQCGGWDGGDPGRAHVFAFWASADAHAGFLAGAHDELAAPQRGTYAGIEVRLFDVTQRIGGWPDLADVAFVRLAHCHVHPRRVAHFVAAQRDVWNPGMGGAPGMRGGVFGARAAAEFLVCSLWSSAAAHEDYVAQRFSDLRARSGAAGDLAAITGHAVPLCPEWTVHP